MSSLRIAMVVHNYPPHRGGVENVCWQHSRLLAKFGHQVYVYTSALPSTLSGAPSRIDDPPGVAVHRLKPTVRLAPAALLTTGLISHLAGVDVIKLYTPYVFGSEMTLLSAKLRKIPVVASFHGAAYHPGYGLRLAAEAYRRTALRLILRAVDRLCVLSPDHPSHYPELRGCRATVVPSGVDPSLFSPSSAAKQELRRRLGLPTTGRLFLSAGRLIPSKRIDRIVMALRGFPDAHLAIVGDGPDLQDLTELVHHYSLESRVHVLGAIDHATMPDYYRSADAFVMASEAECFPLSPLESMACGVPAIVPDLPGVRNMINCERDGFLVQPGDDRSLAWAMGEICSRSEEEVRTMGKRGRRKVLDKYSWDASTRALETVLLSACRR